MALEITGTTRSLTLREDSGMVTLDDPNPSDNSEVVMNYYSSFCPELITAAVHDPVPKDDKAVYEFKATARIKRQDTRGGIGKRKTGNHVYYWTDTGRNSWQGLSSDRHGGKPDTGWIGKNGLWLQAGP